jgi:uncharacterized membrane-anchored protein YitT (DUF2179 family)
MRYMEEVLMNMFNDNEMIKTIVKKNLIKRYITLILSLFVSAFLFNLLILPSELVLGGATGVAVITKYVFNFNPSTVIFVISFALLILSFMYLGKNKTATALIATFLYPFFVEITIPLVELINIDITDKLMISIFIGVIGGLCNGFMYKTGFSAGGLPIISQILHKHFKISISTSSFIINSIIVVIGGLFFGLTMVLYALIVLFINSQLIDRVILGVSKNKTFYIITSKYNEVNDYIINTLDHTTTIIDIKSGFLKQKKKLVLTVIPTSEYFKITSGIKAIDKDVFYWASDTYQAENHI